MATFQGFTVSQPFSGAMLEFFPALGSRQLDDLINQFIPGSKPIQAKRAEVSLNFYQFSVLTGETFRFYPVVLSPSDSFAVSPSGSGVAVGIDHGSHPSVEPSPTSSAWDSPASFSSGTADTPATPALPTLPVQPARLGRAQRMTRATPASDDFSGMPGMRILTKDGLDVTNSASRAGKTPEQREHAHLMRIVKACDSCRRKKIRCELSHRRRLREDGARTQARAAAISREFDTSPGAGHSQHRQVPPPPPPPQQQEQQQRRRRRQPSVAKAPPAVAPEMPPSPSLFLRLDEPSLPLDFADINLFGDAALPMDLDLLATSADLLYFPERIDPSAPGLPIPGLYNLPSSVGLHNPQSSAGPRDSQSPTGPYNSPLPAGVEAAARADGLIAADTRHATVVTTPFATTTTTTTTTATGAAPVLPYLQDRPSADYVDFDLFSPGSDVLNDILVFQTLPRHVLGPARRPDADGTVRTAHSSSPRNARQPVSVANGGLCGLYSPTDAASTATTTSTPPSLVGSSGLSSTVTTSPPGGLDYWAAEEGSPFSASTSVSPSPAQAARLLGRPAGRVNDGAYAPLLLDDAVQATLGDYGPDSRASRLLEPEPREGLEPSYPAGSRAPGHDVETLVATVLRDALAPGVEGHPATDRHAGADRTGHALSQTSRHVFAADDATNAGAAAAAGVARTVADRSHSALHRSSPDAIDRVGSGDGAAIDNVTMNEDVHARARHTRHTLIHAPTRSATDDKSIPSRNSQTFRDCQQKSVLPFGCTATRKWSVRDRLAILCLVVVSGLAAAAVYAFGAAVLLTSVGHGHAHRASVPAVAGRLALGGLCAVVVTRTTERGHAKATQFPKPFFLARPCAGLRPVMGLIGCA